MDIEVIVSKNKEELIARLYNSMKTLHDDMSVRIFKDLKDSEGGSPKPYSTDPLWVSKKNWWANVRDAGVPSKSGKTRYFEGGYSQLKAEIGRSPLELSRSLATGFRTGLRQINDLEFHVILDEVDKVKVDGHFEKFFFPSDEEIENLKKNLGAA